MLASHAALGYSPAMDDYFTLFGLPKSFRLNLAELEKCYFALQRTAHPDRQVGKSDAEKLAATQHAMRINDGYDTLKNPLSRAEYLLMLEGIFVNSEADTETPDHALLMEVMELREQLEEAAQDGPSLLALIEDVKRALRECSEALEEAFEAADFPYAAKQTMRLQYLGKTLEEAHIFLYRFKAAHAEEHSHEHTHH